MTLHRHDDRARPGDAGLSEPENVSMLLALARKLDRLELTRPEESAVLRLRLVLTHRDLMSGRLTESEFRAMLEAMVLHSNLVDLGRDLPEAPERPYAVPDPHRSARRPEPVVNIG